jgi:hypothetical protein
MKEELNSTNECDLYTMAELEEQYIKERQFFRERFAYDSKRDVIHLFFADDYEVDLSEMMEPLDLLRCVAHLTEKNWMKAIFVCEFVKKVCEIKGWDLRQLRLIGACVRYFQSRLE